MPVRLGQGGSITSRANVERAIKRVEVNTFCVIFSPDERFLALLGMTIEVTAE